MHSRRKKFKRKSILKNHPTKSALTTFLTNAITSKAKLLSLIAINLCNANRHYRICALLDTGSDTSYLARHVLRKVSHKIHPQSVSFDVQTLNACKTINTNKVDVQVARNNGSYKTMQFFVQEHPLNIEQEPHKDIQNNPR